VEDATRKVPGVTWVKADSKKREVVVHHADPATLDIEAIKKAINSGLHKDKGEAKLKSHEEKDVDLSSVKDKSAAKKALEGLLGVVRVTLEGKKAKVLVEKDRLTDDDLKKAVDGK